jgi:hypothetical protein
VGIESGIITRLNAVAAVTSLVSNRIYADTLPDGTTHPAIIYQIVSDVPYELLIADTNLYKCRVQFTIISDTKAETISIADALKTALKRFSGTASDITIRDCRLENQYDLQYDLATNETARMADYIFIYEV